MILSIITEVIIMKDLLNCITLSRKNYNLQRLKKHKRALVFIARALINNLHMRIISDNFFKQLPYCRRFPLAGPAFLSKLPVSFSTISLTSMRDHYL